MNSDLYIGRCHTLDSLETGAEDKSDVKTFYCKI